MRWITASFMFVIVMSFCFSLFIIFNWVLYNPDTGIETTLDSFAQENFNRYYRDWWNGINTNISYGFGLAGVICLFLAVICYLADALSGTRRVNVY